MSSNQADWKSFQLPHGRTVSGKEMQELKHRVEVKLVDMTNEQPDETLVEFIFVMMTNHNCFGEIATQLEDVADGDYPEALCEWMVDEVKEVLKIVPSAEEQLAEMQAKFRQLEAEKLKLEQQFERQQKEVIEMKQKGATSSSVSNAQEREIKVRRVENDQGGFQRSRLGNRDPASLSVGEQYAVFLENGFQGDFAQYLDSLKPTSEQEVPGLLQQQLSQEKLETPGPSSHVTLNPEEIAERQKAMSWSRFPKSEEENTGSGESKKALQNDSTASSIMGFGRGRGGIVTPSRRGGFGNKTFVRPGLETTEGATNQSSESGEQSGFGTQVDTPSSGGFGFGRGASTRGRGRGTPAFSNMVYQRSPSGTSNFGEEGNSQTEETGNGEELLESNPAPTSSGGMVWGAGALRDASAQNQTPAFGYSQHQNTGFGYSQQGYNSGYSRGGRGFSRGRGRGRGADRFSSAPFQNQQWVRQTSEQAKAISESLPSTP